MQAVFQQDETKSLTGAQCSDSVLDFANELQDKRRAVTKAVVTTLRTGAFNKLLVKVLLLLLCSRSEQLLSRGTSQPVL